MLVSTALVMLMLLPGLALFYGGLVRAKNLLSVMSQVLGIAAIAILTWVLWDYSLAFGDGNWIIGGLSQGGLRRARPTRRCGRSERAGKAIPELVFAAFQMSFAAITAALVIGALVERVRFSAMMLFAALWLTIVYAPLAHMVWASDGLLFKFGAIDFAGGTVVHINSGVAGLVGVAFAGLAHRPFEGSDAAALAGADDGRRGPAVGRLVRLQRRLGARGERPRRGGDGQHFRRARRRACSTWMGAERLVSGKPSMLGGASGAVAGLVAVTPAAGASGPIGAMLLGARGEPRLLRLRRLAEEPAAARRQPRRVRDPRPRRDYRIDRHRDRRAAGARRPWRRRLCARPPAGRADRGRRRWRSAGRRRDRPCASAAVKLVMPLRHARDAEREGLDIADHGERAYNY